jgi:alpha-galactosidase
MMAYKLLLAAIGACFCAAISSSYAANVSVDPDQSGWSLTSGDNALALRRIDGALYMAWLGPTDAKSKSWQAPLFRAVIDGNSVEPKDLRIESIRTEKRADSARVIATLKHATLPVKIDVACVAWSDTGVFWLETALTNTGKTPVAVQEISSLALTLPGKTAVLRYLDGSRPTERQLKSVQLGAERHEMSNDNLGRSTRNLSTWWSLYTPDTDLEYTAQLAYSGNWTARFEPEGDSRNVTVSIVFDNGGPLRIPPGQSFHVPPAAITVNRGSDIDAGANALHRFQRRHIIPHQLTNDPPLVEFNTWYAFSGMVDAENVSRLIAPAAEIGCEAFVIDANWHKCPGTSQEWQDNLGDWVVNREKFPDGLTPIIKSVHDRGMKFGIWLEPEVASLNSDVVREHPEWFFTLHGKLLTKGISKITHKPIRVHLDYSLPAVRERMMSVIDRLMKEGQIDWFKFDYNIDIGNNFDSRGDLAENTRLYNHLEGYYQWLDEIARKYPHVILENCSSGGRRWDLGIARHTHTSWISDTVNPRYSVQAAYGATIEFVPEICNHWMAGDLKPNMRGDYGATITTTDPGWWDFMFRIAMNGQTGFSSRLDLWTPAALERAKENVALYKRIRGTIAGADVYHLTAAPAAGYNPTGWMALEYFQPAKSSGVVLAYRLGESDPEHQLHLKGLEPGRAYQVSGDGIVAGKRSGEELSKQGLLVRAPHEWRGLVIQFAASADHAATGSRCHLIRSRWLNLRIILKRDRMLAHTQANSRPESQTS